MAAGIEAPRQEEEAASETFDKQSVTFVLEGATLEVAKVGKGYEILNCDEHVSFLKRHDRDPAAYRPDICHQVNSFKNTVISWGGRIACIGLRQHAI